jgi:MbtH protein
MGPDNNPVDRRGVPARPIGEIEMSDDDSTIYTVVINHEEQYSIWPSGRDMPPGWTAVEMTGPKADCLAYIDEVWTDMRPLSLRQRMSETAG